MTHSSLQVLVRSDSDGEHCGRLLKLWQDGDGATLVVGFEEPSGPDLPLGRAARLILRDESLEAPVEAAALVVGRFDGRGGDRYHLRFGQAAYPLIGFLFESRQAPRVRPPEGSTVPVVLRSLEAAAAAVECVLENLSVGGAAVAVPLLHETELAGSRRLRVAILLPGGDAPLVLDCEVRHRSLQGTAVRYGLQFTPAPRPGDASHGRLEAYVRERLSSGDSPGGESEGGGR